VSSEIGARRTAGRGLAVFAIAFLLVYNGARYVFHSRAIAVQEARLYDGQPPQRVLAYPHMANILAWDGIVETESAWIVQPIHLWEDFDPGEGQLIYKASGTPALTAARQTALFRNFTAWSQAPHFRVLPAPGGEELIEVQAVDLWFRFAAKALVAGDAQVRSTSFTFR
jgi:hypothetical protein